MLVPWRVKYNPKQHPKRTPQNDVEQPKKSPATTKNTYIMFQKKSLLFFLVVKIFAQTRFRLTFST